MPVFTDQTGRNINIISFPQRIISLVPSQTELLADLGLDREVVGITKFCIHPNSWFTNKTRVGGTKQIKMDIVHSLHPDLIIANKEENVKEQVDELIDHYPVWISDVHDLRSACDMMEQVGRMTGKAEHANQLIIEIKKRFSEVERSFSADHSRMRASYLIWKDPYMTIGGDTFIHCMLEKAGYENIFSQQLRYPEIELNQLPIANCYFSPPSPTLFNKNI